MKKLSRIIPAIALTGVLALGVGLVPLMSSHKKAQAAMYYENEYMKQLQLPDLNKDYVEKDWKETTEKFLTYVFDERNTYEGVDDSGNPVSKKIARYTQSSNAKAYFKSIGRADEAPDEIWSIPTYLGWHIGDQASGENLGVLGSIMSGALVGMDLVNYECSDGKTRNFVKMAVEYYQYSNGEHFVSNDAGSTTGNTFWYELLPGVMFCVLGTQYESESYYMYDIITETARQWQKAVVGLGGSNADFWHTSYSFSTGRPVDNNRWSEPDAAAGMAYILYSAYSLNMGLKAEGKTSYATDEELESFRLAAVWSMNYLDRLDQSPFYEVLTFLAPYLAARMNAEQGMNYDVAKMMGWLMDGSSAVRAGWGLVTENWGDKYTNGLMGSLTDGDGYAFAMNTFDAMLGFAPLVKYDTRFARDVSRWVLCASQSARNYYPSEYGLSGTTADPGNGNSNFWYGYEQSGNYINPESEEATFIAYEGLRRYRRYVTWENGTRTTAWDYSRTPYASGDAFTFNWGGITDYGLYGSAHVGLFGATIEYTNVPMILRTDLNKLDVYSNGTVPFYMYYNPYTEAKEVEVSLAAEGNKLYDTVEKRFITVTNGKITIPADATLVLAELPAGATVEKNGSDYTWNGEFIAQERGYVNLSVYRDEDCNDKLTPGSSVEGTVYASIEMEVPEGATVESLTLEHGGVSLYKGTTAPTNVLEIDTKLLKNGNGVMTATLTLSGGKVEKSSLLMQVLNVVKTPALSYDSTADMAAAWNAATEAWAAQYPISDHTSTMSANADGSFTVTVGSPKGYGFVTSELFSIDLSRGPMLEFTVSEVNASIGYAIKVYVDGMEVHNNYTGAYILRDTRETGSFTIDILKEIQAEDRTFLMSGAHKASIKISPVGDIGDSVTFSAFNVYHMYTSPVLDEPDTYEWGHNFTSEWLSLWSGSASSGGVNDALLEYTTEGSVIVRASDGANDYSGVASPAIVTDFTMNPVFDLYVKDAKGDYFVGVKFEGNNKLYILSENKAGTIEIRNALKARYPDEVDSFTGSVRMYVILGVKGDGEAEFSQVYTYYKLPEWGSTIRNDGWLEWENAEGTTNIANFELNTSNNRFVITNGAATSNQTATAGVRGKFSLNLDYNPEANIRVRSGTGSYRFVLSTFESGARYVLTDWLSSFGTEPVTVNLRSALGGALTGKQNVWFTIEVRGGGNYVQVDRMETFYTSIQPDFETGATLREDLATWNKDAVNPSNVAVVDGNVVISENFVDSKGLYTAPITISAAMNPHIVVNIASLSDDAMWYLKATIGGTEYALTGEGSNKVGVTDIDVVAALAAAGYTANGEFTAVYEIGGTGVAFAVEIESVRFVRRLASPAGFSHNEDTNVISWESVEDADGYNVRIENAEGEVVREETGYTMLTYNVGALNLEDGVYRLYISAYGGARLESAEVRFSFKQGDIPSVTLGKAQNFRNNGMLVEWNEVADIEYYEVILTDSDSGNVILSKELTEARLDLAEVGLVAFNFKVSVQAKGDGVVYLDGEKAEYAFYTNVLENYNASKFASMSATSNQAYAEYDASSDTAAIRIPYTNWGGIVTLNTQLNFDKSPVLSITFAAGCEGGYYLQIVIDGVTYYLADNTFTIHGNTEQIHLFVDILGTLATRKDGPTTLPAGLHNVAIVFGATSDGFSGVNTPVVRIASAQLIEMTEGRGTQRLGTLATPVVTISGRTVSWNAIEHAESYTVVISNELGVLNVVVVTETTYDLSWILRAGEYTVQVTATASNYFSSDTGSATIEITEESNGGEDTTSKRKGCKGAISGTGAVIGVGILAVAACVLLKKRKSNKS